MGFFKGDNGRTEKATSKRRGDARKKGQIARSPSLPSAVVLLGLFWLLGIYAPAIVQNLAGMLHRVLGNLQPQEMTPTRLQELMVGCAIETSKAVFIFTGAACLLSVAANAAQGGLVFSTYKLGFHFENLNPASGIKRLLPSASVVEMLKNVLTIGIVTHFGYSVYKEAQDDLPRFMLMSPLIISMKSAAMIYRVAFKSAVYLVILAVCDYLWKGRQFEEQLKMTKQEVKDEAKNADGNPEVRSRIKGKQREIAMRRMMAAVPKADVVITNPTHFAVALAYQPGKMAAPIVVAKGQDHVAMRIRELAKENKVPLVENKPLARTLYKLVEVGGIIPGDLFKAVAEVLAFVYKLKQTRL
jgi:flagellar biosynthetic protein FlhB